jgi:hypothetical protein
MKSNGNGTERRLAFLEKVYREDRERWREQSRHNNRVLGILKSHDRLFQRQNDHLKRQGDELKRQGDELKRQGDELKRQGDRLEAAQKMLYRKHEGL